METGDANKELTLRTFVIQSIQLQTGGKIISLSTDDLYLLLCSFASLEMEKSN